MKMLDRYVELREELTQLTRYVSLARALGHREPNPDCLGRRQGLCPGPDLCHDCSWAEGTSREQD